MKTTVMQQAIVTTHIAPVIPITEVVEDNSPVVASKRFSIALNDLYGRKMMASIEAKHMIDYSLMHVIM